MNELPETYHRDYSAWLSSPLSKKVNYEAVLNNCREFTCKDVYTWQGIPLSCLEKLAEAWMNQFCSTPFLVFDTFLFTSRGIGHRNGWEEQAKGLQALADYLQRPVWVIVDFKDSKKEFPYLTHMLKYNQEMYKTYACHANGPMVLRSLVGVGKSDEDSLENSFWLLQRGFLLYLGKTPRATIYTYFGNIPTPLQTATRVVKAFITKKFPKLLRKKRRKA